VVAQGVQRERLAVVGDLDERDVRRLLQQFAPQRPERFAAEDAFVQHRVWQRLAAELRGCLDRCDVVDHHPHRPRHVPHQVANLSP
jgi:hypothetical protein